MLARLRFWLYRNLVAAFTLLAFRSQKVLPLEAPVAGPVQFKPYAEAHPEMAVKSLVLPTTFPAGDHAAKRRRRIKAQTFLLALVDRIAPRATPPVPRDERRFVAALYPRFFHRAWPAAPSVPAALSGADDLIAELAVRGPYASYLRRRDDSTYVVDVNWIARVRRRPRADGPGRHGGVHRSRRRPRDRAHRTRGRDTRARARGVPRRAQRGPHDVPSQRVGPPRDADVVRARFHESPGSRAPRTAAVAPLFQHGADRKRRARVGPAIGSEGLFRHDLLARRRRTAPHGPRPLGPLRLLGLRTRPAIRTPGYRRDALPVSVPRQHHAVVGADAYVRRELPATVLRARRGRGEGPPSSRRGQPCSTGCSPTASKSR